MVYLGRSIQTSEPVAVKVIDKKIFSNAYNVKNIQSEIDIMKKVSHDNIVRLHDIYQTANNMYIVTEFCQDGDLFKLLQKRKKIPESEAKGFLKDIMNGAKYLHKNGIIHRDLKPANILLKNGVCKLSDFGFAKSLNSEEAVMKSIVGTPLYMSPQILKKGKYTTKSDLWSIGLIYYEMLHGRTPWPAQNQIELINGIYNKKIAFSPEISEKSKDFIKRCLEIYEEDRISWEEAFTHRLLQEEVRKVKPLDLEKIRELAPEDKQNHGSISNKAKTPTNHGRKEGKDEKSPIPFKNKELKERRVETQCLTPKEKLTPKGKSDKSGFKNPKSELTDKKEEKDASTVKKRIIREASQNQYNIKPDRLKYY